MRIRKYNEVHLGVGLGEILSWPKPEVSMVQALARSTLPRLAATVLFIAGAVVGFIHYFSPGQLAIEQITGLNAPGRGWNRNILQWTEPDSAETLRTASDGTGSSSPPLQKEEEHET